MDFIVVYNIIYTKPEWCKDTSFAHLLVNHQKPLGCEENGHCICYTLLEKKDNTESLLVPLSDSVAIVIKNINLPKQELNEQKEEKEKKEERNSHIDEAVRNSQDEVKEVIVKDLNLPQSVPVQEEEKEEKKGNSDASLC
jgi:hypothetical protein